MISAYTQSVNNSITFIFNYYFTDWFRSKLREAISSNLNPSEALCPFQAKH